MQAFVLGALTWLAKTFAGAVFIRLSTFIAAQAVLFLFFRWWSEFTGTDNIYLNPFDVIAHVASSWSAFQSTLGGWPGVVWAFDYWNIGYGIQLYGTALMSRYASDLILKALTK